MSGGQNGCELFGIRLFWPPHLADMHTDVSSRVFCHPLFTQTDQSSFSWSDLVRQRLITVNREKLAAKCVQTHTHKHKHSQHIYLDIDCILKHFFMLKHATKTKSCSLFALTPYPFIMKPVSLFTSFSH